MADPLSYEDIYDSRDDLSDARESASDWLTNYYEDPVEVASVSDNLAKLLDPNSDYMLDAQQASKKEREQRGYLDSGFNEGMGTVAAIDNAFDTALSDTYTSMYNQDEINKANRESYFNAYETALSAMFFQGTLTTSERAYLLSKEREDTSFENILELSDVKWDNEAEVDSQAHDDLMDRHYYQFEANKAILTEASKRQHEMTYLHGYANIIGSDIKQEDKYDQLVGLANQVGWASDSIVKEQDTTISGSPYELSYINYLNSISPGSRNSEAFIWSMSDATHKWGQARDVIDDIDDQIHDQTSHAERNEYKAYRNLEVIRDSFGKLKTTNPEGFKDIMEWWALTGSDEVGDDWEDVIEDWARLTDEYSGRAAALAAPASDPSDGGGLYRLNPNRQYEAYVLNDDNTKVVKVYKDVYSDETKNAIAWAKWVAQGGDEGLSGRPLGPDPAGSCGDNNWDYQYDYNSGRCYRIS